MEVADQVIDPIEEESLEDTIRAAINSGREEVSAEAVANPAPSVTRDEAGKFAPTERVRPRETLTLVKPVEAAAEAVAAAVGAEVPAAVTTFKAPDGLKPELKAKFPALDPEWQAEWVRREGDTHKALTKQDEERSFGRKVSEIVSPYLPTIRAEGGTPEKAIESLLQTAHVLRAGTPAQKAQALHTVAQQFNVDLSLPLQQGHRDPNIAHLERQVQELTGQLQGFTQQRQNQETQSLFSQIEEFKSKPGHEHFDAVRTKMGALIESGEATDLDDAYDQAVHANRDIRSSLIASATQAESEKRRIAAQAATEAAKRAGGSVSGGPGAARSLSGSGAEVPLEETIRAAIRESNGRV